MGLELPSAWPVLEDEAVSFATAVIGACAAAGRLEAELHRSTGRPRSLEVRAVLVALLLLAMEGRPLHLTEVTRLLYCRLSASCKEQLAVFGEAGSRKGALARYRCVRYLFHEMLEADGPIARAQEPGHAGTDELVAKRRRLTAAEVSRRRQGLESFVSSLLEASTSVLTAEEMSAYDGSVGLDATVVPLYSRGPSKGSSTCASDPDGGWYVRDGDHRDEEGPRDRKASQGLLGARGDDRHHGPATRCGSLAPEPRRRAHLGPPGRGPGRGGRAGARPARFSRLPARVLGRRPRLHPGLT